ncbi:putative P-loop containing nucleoside triphosphate hydrolase, leucine-rich repeat domain superfamily [Helianthus annuus]|nr:putative P-loop containing nucleoside triphosphate hydrolase, leucine-rich repeat domain superfamily [Helianthus annuus]
MAEIIASELLRAVFKKLSSEAVKKIGRSQGIQSELKKLERTLTQIQSLLNDASQKEITEKAVQNWLNGLQHLAYDIDDVLDDLETQAMHHELTQESGAITSKVKKLVPTCCINLSLSQRMHHKLDDITTKLQDLEKEKVTLGLIVKDERSKRTYQTSLVDTSGIVGRQEEKKELLVKLLGDEPCDKNFSIVPIVGMGGLGKTTLEFPDWVGDPSFLQLIQVFIHGCKTCTSLPPLGQLPSLKRLFIKDMDEVKAMGSELAGTGLSFPSLEVLLLENMKRLEEWSTNKGVVSFPCLKELAVRNCPNLVQVSPEALPSLNMLEVSECDGSVLRSLVQVASGVSKLKIESISGLDDVAWRGVIEYLGAVECLSIKNCNEIRYLWESMASKALIRLMYLDVLECQKLVRLGEKEEGDSCGSNVLTTLRTLKIEKCESMEHCRCPNNIEELKISDCPSITSVSFPTTAGGQKLKFLTINGCDKLLEKELIFGGDNTRVLVNNTSMPMLQTVALHSWPNLTKITELSQLIHLTYLRIVGCPNMESFPDHELPNLTSLTHLVIRHCPSTNDSFPCGNWPPNLQILSIGRLKKPILEWGPQNFPTSLVRLVLYCGESEEDDASRCSQLSHLLPSSLTSLRISRFKKLKSVSVGVQHLTSLQRLSLWNCPKMKYLPDILLPSLLSLSIMYCPKLEGRCSRRGSYWSRISHIPRITINEE